MLWCRYSMHVYLVAQCQGLWLTYTCKNQKRENFCLPIKPHSDFLFLAEWYFFLLMCVLNIQHTNSIYNKYFTFTRTKYKWNKNPLSFTPFSSFHLTHKRNLKVLAAFSIHTFFFSLFLILFSRLGNVCMCVCVCDCNCIPCAWIYWRLKKRKEFEMNSENFLL